MEFDEYVGSLTGRKLNEHARLAVVDALSMVQPDIVRGKLDGAEITYRMSLRWRMDGHAQDILVGSYKSGMQDPEGGAYDYNEIADGKHADSMDTGMSVIELLRRGVACRSEYHGNVVVPLSMVLDVVMSGSGLSEAGDQTFCGLAAYNFQRRLLVDWYDARPS